MYFNSSGRRRAFGVVLLMLFAISDFRFAEKVKRDKNSTTEVKKPAEGKVVAVDEKPELVVQHGHTDGISGIKFSPDSKSFLTSSWDSTINLWETSSGKILGTFPTQARFTEDANFSKNGKLLIFCADKTIALYNSTSGQILWKFIADFYALTCVFSPDEKHVLFTGSKSAEVQFLNAATGSIEKSEKLGILWGLSFSGDGKLLLGRSRCEIKVFDTSLKKITDFKFEKMIQRERCSDRPQVHKFLVDQKTIFSSVNGTIVFWTARTGKVLRKFHVAIADQDKSFIWAILTPDEKNIIAISEKRRMLLDAKDGSLISDLGIGGSTAVDISPNSRFVVFAPNIKAPIKIEIWSTSEKSLKKDISVQSDHAHFVRYNEESKRIFQRTSLDTVNVWNIPEGTLETRPPQESDRLKHWNDDWGRNGRAIGCGVGNGKDKIIQVNWHLRTGGKATELDDWPRERLNKIVGKMVGHTGNVTHCHLTSNGKITVSSATDHTIKIWNTDTKELLLTMVAFKDNSADGSTSTGLVYTPDGRFDVTDEKAKRYVSYRKGDKFFDLVDIQKKYRVKGLLQKVLSGKLDEPESRIDRDTKHMPKLKIIYPDTDASSHVFTPDELSKEKFPLKFRPVDSGGGLSYAEVRLDGRLVGTIENLKDKTDVEIDVPLFQGMNRISITVKNKLEMGSAENIQVEFDAKKKLKKPSLHFLAVGVNNYAGSNKLSFARNDAEAMATAIQKFGDQLKKEGVYENVTVHTLFDDQAFKKAVKDKIKEITKAAGREDVIMIYFSGHGASIREPGTGDKFYAYLPQDFPFSGMTYESLLNDGVHGKFLEEQLSLKNTQAKKVVLILDTCQSGDIATMFAMKKSGQESDTAVLSDLVAGSGIFVLASSAGEQVSRESDKINHGIFTQVLLEGLVDKRADTNNNGIVTIVELGNYLRVNVDAKLKEVFGKQEKQTPRIVEMGRDDWAEAYNDFPLARVR